MSPKPATVLALLLALLTLACGGPAHPRTPGIDELRRAADARPDDPAAAYAVAEGELLLDGGDPTRAQARIVRAIELAPEDVRLHYLAGVERELHGDPAAALQAFLRVVEVAASSDDPLAPAIAEVTASQLEGLDDTAPGYVERVQGALGPLHASPGGIGAAARSTVADLLVDLAYRRGDLARVGELQREEHCVTRWRVAGPFGPRGLLGFDSRLGADADAELGARYDLGPSRGMRDTREVEARGCSVHVGNGPVGGAGTTFAEGTIEIAEAGRYELRLETPNPVELLVDGERVMRLDMLREPIGRTSFHVLELAAGTHRVRARVTSRHANPVLMLSFAPAEGEPGGGDVRGESLLSQLLRAQRALARGDVVAARELVRDRLGPEGSPAFLVLGAAIALSDPLRSSEVGHDESRRLLQIAGDRDPQAWFPVLTLAQLEANEGRDVEALEALRAAGARWPGHVMIPLSLVDLYSRRGWHAQADEAVARAREVAPDACRPLRAALNRARRLNRAGDEAELAERLVSCDARSDARLTTHVRRRDWPHAIEELDRLAALEPSSNPIPALQARIGIAQGRGDDAEVGRLISQLQERMPQAAGPVMLEVDRLFARREEQQARRRMERALAEEPEAMIELRRALRAMGGASPLERYRLDGAQVIREFESSGRTYREPMVLVLDYTVHRVFADGSMLELTHNVFRLQSQEAVDAMGELEVPEGAQPLTLQTVKADGRRLEPDEIAGKETISFASLAVGDYIEFEYLRPRGSAAGYPGGFVGERFYFQSFETPFDRSELTVVVPREIELAIDPRGPAPRTETREDDGTRVYQWRVRESRPLVQEPGSVASVEFLPSIYWGHGASWDQYVESLRDVLADRDVRDPAVERLVREIAGEGASPEARARRIYAWALREIDDSQDLFGQAAAMVAARSGNRTRALRYLLAIAGVPAELALVRSFTADSTRSELPDDDLYQNLLIRIRSDGGDPIWLSAGAQDAPFGYIPPPLAGMDALVLNEQAERATVTERSLEADLRRVEVEVALRGDGGARVTVVESYRGAGAVLWRNQLEEVPEAELERQFESGYVANLLPGSTLERLVISGREDPEGELVLRYEVEMPSLARRAGGRWIVPPIYRARLGPQFAPVAARTTTELVPAGLALDVSVRVRGPSGALFQGTPSEASLEALGASMMQRVARESDALLVQRSYRVPRLRIATGDYAAFARFCRAADEAEASEIAVRM